MSQSYVWVVSWEYSLEMKYKVFTNKVNALNFKYQLENNPKCYDVRLEKRFS